MRALWDRYADSPEPGSRAIAEAVASLIQEFEEAAAAAERGEGAGA